MTTGLTLLWRCVVTLVLLHEHTAQAEDVAGLAVDPPANIRITDPGHLGYLSIEWSRPSSLQNLTDCTVRYQLRFYDTFTGRWKSVRTTGLSYKAQFDLEKPIQVRMLTLVNGACTKHSEVQGEEVEFVHTPEHTGVAGSRIRDFHCVYFNKEYMDCTWQPGSADPPQSEHSLYYWHREMQETSECPQYIRYPELRRGCRFPREVLLEFSEFNMCVNGSSAAGALEPAFISLEVQNQVKPAAVSELQVLSEDGLLQVQWSPPEGRVPEHCLEYELEGTTESMDGSMWQWTNVTEETTLDFPWSAKREMKCFRIRSKVSGYCADDGYWSDWSQSTCFPEKREKIPYEPWNAFVLIVMLVIVVTAFLIFCFMIWLVRKMWMKRKDQKYTFCTRYQEKVQKAFPPILSPVCH
uniref:Interleukin 13 receptor, alpha 2 n=1 Tax=Astyanax mexicanus TaxID=7994 RepID=A0A3B1IGI5_ASTMX